MLIVHNGLDTTYEAFVTAQSSQEDDILFTVFQGLLQAHDERFVHTSLPARMPMANAISTDVIICHICQKKGHSAISCYNRHNKNRFPTIIDKKSRYRLHSGSKSSNSVNAIWYLDPGATDHVIANTFDTQNRDFTPMASNGLIANGNKCSVLNSGSSSFSVANSQIRLNNILHVPDVKKNLLSVKKIYDENDFSVTFDSSSICIKDRKSNKVLLTEG